MEVTMKQQDACINKEITQVKHYASVAKKRICDDLTSLPFLFIWSTLICLMLDRATDEKVNAYLEETFNEGIGLRTILGMLMLSMLLTGVAWLIRPARDNLLYKLLLAPVGAARSACMTTLAFVMGLTFAIAITPDLDRAGGMLASLGILVALWLMLNALEVLATEASNNREKEYKWACIALGALITLGGLAIVYLLYCQIQSGHVA
jgi:hypothetical protein